MRQVELQTAYHWHCEDCGAENFALPAKAELTEEDRENVFRKFHDLEEWAPLPEGWQNFEVVTVPDAVTCSHCGATFKAYDPRADDADWMPEG